ncbi:MAG: ATPase domain-containing protein [Candidatus Bathyarchaeia archaeon]|nr:AAA family ATPase [Candidatus Bathyarchaeota archaeon]
MERVSTGIKGLDELLKGGFPKGRCILIVGGPGSGKTIFAIQFLKAGAEAGERGLYVTLDESLEQIKMNMASLGWNIDKLENEGKLFLLDATPFRQPKKVEEESFIQETFMPLKLTLKGLITTIQKMVKEEDIQRIAVDPITALTLRYEKPYKKRRAILAFFDALTNSGCTSIVTSELKTSMLERSFQIEEFLSQGVILLHSVIHEGNVIRAIQIEKMRGVDHDPQIRPYKITSNGIEVFPRDIVFKPSLI